jgi:hypothetical protein
MPTRKSLLRAWIGTELLRRTGVVLFSFRLFSAGSRISLEKNGESQPLTE